VVEYGGLDQKEARKDENVLEDSIKGIVGCI
jgi:hypothetical protein